MNMQLRFIIFTIFVLTINIFPQRGMGSRDGTITGKVFDKSSSYAIEYANIVVLSKAHSSVITGTVSDADGNFSISRFPFGNYFVDVRFIGFTDQRCDVTISREKLNLALGEFYLEPAALNLYDIV